MNCFTFEASFHGHFDGQGNNYEFNESTFEEMGEHLVSALYENQMIMEEEERRKRIKELNRRKAAKLKRKAMQANNNVSSAGIIKDVS